MTGKVECRSEYTYAQEPLSFEWGGEKLRVEEVEARWRTPLGPAFRVRTIPGRFVLRYLEPWDEWVVSRLERTRR